MSSTEKKLLFVFLLIIVAFALWGREGIKSFLPGPA